MNISLNQHKKIFIICAAVTVLGLCAYTFFVALRESGISALASSTIKNVSIKLPANTSYQVGQKYSLSWSSDCRGGTVMVWLSTASSSKANIGILVPLASFSAADFGTKSQDDRIFFNDPWKFILSQNANKGKITWTVPQKLSLDKSLFGGSVGVYYIYSLADGRYALHKIVEQLVEMSVMPDNYYLRVDIKGKNGCEATGYSSAIKIIR